MWLCFYPRLVGDVLLCTGFLSYSGPFNQEFRDMLMGKWQKDMKSRKIPFTANLNVTGMLVDAATVGIQSFNTAQYVTCSYVLGRRVDNGKFCFQRMLIRFFFFFSFLFGDSRSENGIFRVYQTTNCQSKMASSLPRQHASLC